jgi:hypothetical protein
MSEIDNRNLVIKYVKEEAEFIPEEKKILRNHYLKYSLGILGFGLGAFAFGKLWLDASNTYQAMQPYWDVIREVTNLEQINAVLENNDLDKGLEQTIQSAIKNINNSGLERMSDSVRNGLDKGVQTEFGQNLLQRINEAKLLISEYPEQTIKYLNELKETINTQKSNDFFRKISLGSFSLLSSVTCALTAVFGDIKKFNYISADQFAFNKYVKKGQFDKDIEIIDNGFYPEESYKQLTKRINSEVPAIVLYSADIPSLVKMSKQKGMREVFEELLSTKAPCATQNFFTSRPISLN